MNLISILYSIHKLSSNREKEKKFLLPNVTFKVFFMRYKYPTKNQLIYLAKALMIELIGTRRILYKVSMYVTYISLFNFVSSLKKLKI